MRVDPIDVRQGEVAAADAGLVGDDEQFKAGELQPLQRRRRARKDFHLLDLAEIILLHNDRSIAVEENGAVHGRAIYRSRSGLAA